MAEPQVHCQPRSVKWTHLTVETVEIWRLEKIGLVCYKNDQSRVGTPQSNWTYLVCMPRLSEGTIFPAQSASFNNYHCRDEMLAASGQTRGDRGKMWSRWRPLFNLLSCIRDGPGKWCLRHVWLHLLTNVTYIRMCVHVCLSLWQSRGLNFDRVTVWPCGCGACWIIIWFTYLSIRGGL